MMASPTNDNDWLQAAITQLKTGIPFFVKFLGKVTLPRSINDVPDDDDRAEIVTACLRKVAILTGHIETAFISTIAEDFLKDATVIARNTNVQLSVYSNAFILADLTTQRIVARHNTTEVAFAHVDPDYNDVIGYYCVDHRKGKPDTRCYYVIASDSASQILASMKLAFVVLSEQTASATGIVSTQNVADLLTPTPSVPPTPSGAYCLLRLSTPSDDGTGFVHSEKTVSTETLQRTVRRLTPTFSGTNFQSSMTPSTPGSVTNVYFNVNMVQGVNPYTSNTIYPDIFAKYFRQSTSKEGSSRRLSTVEEIQDVKPPVKMVAIAPPLPPKQDSMKGEPLKNVKVVNNMIDDVEPDPGPIKYVTYSRSIVDPPPPPPRPSEPPPEATIQQETRAAFYPEITVNKDADDDELKRLQAELQRVKDQIKKRNTAMVTRPVPSEPSPQTIQKPKTKHSKRVMFQKLRKSVSDFGVPLKSKLGSLRMGAIKQKPQPPMDAATPGSISDCTSLNSSVFDAVSLESPSTHSASSADSGVQHDNDLFVFPEVPNEASHWAKRILKIENPLPLTAVQFGQISEYLALQPWFHGTVRRELAEARLVQDGEFLVRQSASQPGQFIVSALRRNMIHHIRVVNCDGQIRSHAGDFGSVVQLIQYHFTTKTPLCSKTAAIMLMTPVPRPAFWLSRQK